MPECLPSLRTVQRLVHSTYAYHMEGVFQFKGLEEHLNLYKAKKLFQLVKMLLDLSVEWTMTQKQTN